MSVVLSLEPESGTMNGRGGFPIKTVIYAVFLLGLVYMVYIYNNSQNNLREAEMVGSRYKREAEERVVEIQELVKTKDRSQETCQNEKTELHNRIKSLTQQLSMVQSQYKETEADFIKLKQDMDTMAAEHAQANSAHAAEYEKLKQDKEIEIVKLKDEVADLTRRNQNFQFTVSDLQQKLKEKENSYKQVSDQNIQLKQLLQNNFHPEAAQLTPRNLGQPNFRELSKDLQDLGNFGSKRFDPNQLVNSQNGQSLDARDSAATFSQANEFKPHAVDEHQDSIHQVRPPININIEKDNKIETADKDRSEIKFQPEANPNDQQKAQILQPVLDHGDRQPGGGEEGVVNMNARKEEERRETNEKKEEADSLHPKDPLSLGQIEVPHELNDLSLNEKDEVNQIPPVLNDEQNDQRKDADRAENNYFGEEDGPQQPQQEDYRRRPDEDEREEGEEGNVDRFPEDVGGNQDNKEAAEADRGDK